MAVAEKAVLQISDLLDWIADPKEISWDRGLLGFANADCEPQPPGGDKGWVHVFISRVEFIRFESGFGTDFANFDLIYY